MNEVNYGPGEVYSVVLENHSHDRAITASVKDVVERHRVANENEHKRKSEYELRRAIQNAHPNASPERVSEILKRQLSPSRQTVTVRSVHLTARDIARNERKSKVKARRAARR